MTFLMESPMLDLGRQCCCFGMAYGLAQKEERASFVDDSRWYVKYFAVWNCADLHQGLWKYTNFL